MQLSATPYRPGRFSSGRNPCISNLSRRRYLRRRLKAATSGSSFQISDNRASGNCMYRIGRPLFLLKKSLHTISHDRPSETLKRKIAELERIRKIKNQKKNEVFVEVPESRAFLDTATMPMILTAVGVALFAKILMMYDESKSQELIERKFKNAPPGQGTVRMLTHEEWDKIREVRPRTPFESKLARPNARIRTGEPLKMEDLKDWTIDVFMDAVTRAEDAVRHGSR
ncbi:hypothetical protein Nepgr_026148 [Nepenthes gracilis]|uniref:Uncharacterized protein n=1 Tax=Nepenthes gracilis TaxID=150966 RepID=A0AAD3T6E7_NEPGR|nr:hypothetical protein Nepgr_026148 [Nepenthes gracilis]